MVKNNLRLSRVLVIIQVDPISRDKNFGFGSGETV